MSDRKFEICGAKKSIFHVAFAGATKSIFRVEKVGAAKSIRLAFVLPDVI